MSRERKLLSILQPGDIININTKVPLWNLVLRWVYGAIRRYQKRKYGRDSRWRDIHTMIYLGDKKIFSFESPRAILLHFGKLKGIDKRILFDDPKCLKRFRINKRSRYTVCRLLNIDGSEHSFSPFELRYLIDSMAFILGRRYDYGQLLDILLKQIFSKFIPTKLSIFDLGRKRKVCSVAVHWLLSRLWRMLQVSGIKSAKFDKIFGDQYIEVTCPADFVNHPEQFKIVSEEI